MSDSTAVPAGAGAGPRTATPHATVSSRDAGRVAFAAFVGTALEWYDYFLFGTAAALVFNRLYFSTLDPTAATLAAFATFGVGFVARPVGAVVFGAVGDRIGRRPALLITVVLIGAATGLIGLLPDFAAIGVAAPALLVLLRLAQGVAVGGEWGGAVTLAVEHAPPDKRSRYAALPQLGSPVGTLMSSGAFALVLLLPDATFDSWGWRLPFLAAFPLLVVAFYIRRRVEESPIFDELLRHEADRPKIPAGEVFRHAWVRLVVAIAAAFLGVGGFYVLTTFAISYGVDSLGLSRGLMVNATLVAAVVEMVVIVVIGRLADRLGPGRMTFWGGVASAVLAYPVFALLTTRSPAAVVLAISAGIAALSIAYAVTGALLTELFPARYRYSGVALAYNIAGALSGFLPFVATAMTGAIGDDPWVPAVLLIGVSLVTVVGGFVGERMRVRDEVVVT
ncbi:MFS transporter [Geodermatophilus sp. SYSU D00697]